MNRYPVWKYATLLVALLIGALYTLSLIHISEPTRPY